MGTQQNELAHGSSQVVDPVTNPETNPEAYHQGDEKTGIRIEKAVAETGLQETFSNDIFRFTVDDERKPKISYRTGASTYQSVPESHITLYRIEKRLRSENGEETIGDGWKMCGLFLLVHVGPECPWETLLWKCFEIVVEKDDAGELARPHSSLNIVQRGMEPHLSMIMRGDKEWFCVVFSV